MYNLLEQAVAKTTRNSGMNPFRPADFFRMVRDDAAYTTYRDSLAEGLNESLLPMFNQLADNSRIKILEANNAMQFSPYEIYTLPLLRRFVPRRVGNLMVNNIPMNGPEIDLYCVVGKFKKHGQANYYNSVDGDQTFPVTTGDISRGPSKGVATTATSSRGMNAGVATDILATFSLTAADAHLEKDFIISGITDSTSTVAVNIKPDVNGFFSSAVTTFGGDADVISGNVNYETGVLTWSTKTGAVVSVDYQAYLSMEENTISPTMRFSLDKFSISAVMRQITAEWTLPFEQDLKALFDLSVQSQLVNMIGEQIALDMDREIITDLFNANATSNPATHTDTFDITPEPTFNGTQVDWFKNITYKLNKLTAVVSNDTNMGPANIIACNPTSAAILESINSFRYDGDSFQGGDLGYQTGSIQSGKWTVVTTNVIPENKMMLLYKSNDIQRTVYAHCPYVPVTLHPYPLGTTPSLSVMTRYGKRIIHPNGIAVLNIIES